MLIVGLGLEFFCKKCKEAKSDGGLTIDLFRRGPNSTYNDRAFGQ